MPNKADMVTYRINSPFVGMLYDPSGRYRFATIPRAAVIIVTEDMPDFGVVETECDGQRLAVFRRDIDERAERVDHPSGHRPAPSKYA